MIKWQLDLAFVWVHRGRFNPWWSYHFAWSLYDDLRPLFTSTKGKFADLQWFLACTGAISSSWLPLKRAKFQNRNFAILIADLNSSQKSMNWKCSPFWLEHGQIQGQRLKLIFYLNLPLFSALNLKFDNVPIIISKKGKHFQFILFWEEFKSAIRLVKFLL